MYDDMTDGFRFVMTPMHDMRFPIALVAWGNVLQSSCFNEIDFDEVRAHAHGPVTDSVTHRARPWGSTCVSLVSPSIASSKIRVRGAVYQDQLSRGLRRLLPHRALQLPMARSRRDGEGVPAAEAPVVGERRVQAEPAGGLDRLFPSNVVPESGATFELWSGEAWEVLLLDRGLRRWASLQARGALCYRCCRCRSP